jgi:hypothetical protein
MKWTGERRFTGWRVVAAVVFLIGLGLMFGCVGTWLCPLGWFMLLPSGWGMLEG